ncbi:hypothetical protein [Sphingomonas sediminicola]|nr:hypothetical protein [Sphingomonas sediminicola]
MKNRFNQKLCTRMMVIAPAPQSPRVDQQGQDLRQLGFVLIQANQTI